MALKTFVELATLACESIRFSFALRRWGRFARRNLLAKRPQRRRAKEKRMLSQAIATLVLFFSILHNFFYFISLKLVLGIAIKQKAITSQLLKGTYVSRLYIRQFLSFHAKGYINEIPTPLNSIFRRYNKNATPERLISCQQSTKSAEFCKFLWET